MINLTSQYKYIPYLYNFSFTQICIITKYYGLNPISNRVQAFISGLSFYVSNERPIFSSKALVLQEKEQALSFLSG